MRPLTFWFEFASPYSYLSASRIEDLAARAGVSLIWRPFLLGPIFAEQGWQTSPFNIYPAKGRYMWRDMERQAQKLSLPFRKPAGFPQNGLRAARIAQLAVRRPQGPAFCRAVFRAQFEAGADIAHTDTLLSCLRQAGMLEALLDAAETPGPKQALRACTDLARKAGVFGAPSFTVDGELFWGDDRLEDALDWARHATEST